MFKPALAEVLPERLADHRAVQAWQQIGAKRFEPESIEILKRKRKTAVYRLVGADAHGPAIIAKRCRATTALVERLIYEELLARLPLPSLRCHGFVAEPDGQYCWLFLEDAGRRKYSPANQKHRVLAGQWLGTVHRAALSPAVRALLPDRGSGHYLGLLQSARAALHEHAANRALLDEDVALLQTIAAQCDRIEEHWPELERYAESRPYGIVHGDFVAKNLRIRSGVNGPALLVYDWEMAGWGWPATDVAQSLGRCVSPDLPAYCSALRQNFPKLQPREIRRLAAYGNVLRVVDKIFWETVTMEGDSYEFLLKPLLTLQNYQPQLTAALRTLHWNGHD